MEIPGYLVDSSMIISDAIMFSRLVLSRNLIFEKSGPSLITRTCNLHYLNPDDLVFGDSNIYPKHQVAGTYSDSSVHAFPMYHLLTPLIVLVKSNRTGNRFQKLYEKAWIVIKNNWLWSGKASERFQSKLKWNFVSSAKNFESAQKELRTNSALLGLGASAVNQILQVNFAIL